MTALLLAAIVLLIAGIHDFEFLPARPLEYTMVLSGGPDSTGAIGWRVVTVLVRVLLIISLVVVLFQLVFSKLHRKYYIVLIMVFAAILLATDFVGCNRMPPAEVEMRGVDEMMAQPEVEAVAQPELEVVTSRFQYVILAIGLSGAVVLAGGLCLRKWLRSRRQAASVVQDEILESLANAAHRIRAGEDAYTVVLLCYQEMLRILSTAGRIDATYLTPREFERRLQSIGLAGSAVTQLTDMFELVRYARRIDDTFATRALTCLNAIQEAHATPEP
ncbi:DUF4129 domain-containing protein [Candidatus Bipolaricaulota bacterium]|nr:DUF4129 domain-containing protein [Candidatus Bipolaricaulota bacterium]